MRRMEMMLFLLFFIMVGCQSKESQSPSRTSLRSIMKALQIHEPKERDAALASACRESSAAGTGEAVMVGIARIEEKKLRDDVAEECAMIFHESDDQKVAEDIANLITNEKRRTEVLSKIESGT